MRDKACAELGFGGVQCLWAHFEGVISGREADSNPARSPRAAGASPVSVLLWVPWVLHRGGLRAPQGRQVHAVCSNSEGPHPSLILGGGPEDGRFVSTGLSQGIPEPRLLPGQLVSSPRVHLSLSEGRPGGHRAVSTCGGMLVCADISHLP